MPAANLAQRVAALRLQAKGHKAALGHHRRQLRLVMADLAEVEARCARLGLTVEPVTPTLSEGTKFHG